MLTPSELARIARRYDTAMSRAMLRALGLPLPLLPSPPAAPSPRGDPRYAGLAWCMANLDPGTPGRA